jgi:N-acetylglucosaminyl-diphospho-decaprenol L-rhamnosyltransferase
LLAERVTVVLLTYNCGHRLRQVLDHLGRLGVPIVAVDNASRDATAAILHEYDGVDVVQLSSNIGAAARNRGAERVQTPYIAFCDDDGWFERAGLEVAVAALERYPELALVNARILVGPDDRLDPVCAEMADSPLPERNGIPGRVLLGFMAGAVVVRAAAFRDVGGYDPRFFIASEEETLAVKFARAGWQMRYLDDVVAHHEPSRANAPTLRPYLIRNTLWNCWLHRRFRSAVRKTIYTLSSAPKDRDWLRAVMMTLAGMRWVLRERRPMDAALDQQYRILDERDFSRRAHAETFPA